MKRLFETWDAYIEREHKELNELFKERMSILDIRSDYWSENIAPLKRQETAFRDELLRSTARERLAIEEKIDNLVDLIEERMKEHNITTKKMYSINKDIKEYINAHFTKKERKYANEHGWIW